MKSSKRETGDIHEQDAANYLQSRGLKLLASNHSSRHGEIDLIMQDQETLVFIEVRYRRNRNFGGAAISVTPKKQRKIALTALHYLQKHKKTNTPCRFDVIAVTGEGTLEQHWICLLYTSPSPRDGLLSRMPSSA